MSADPPRVAWAHDPGAPGDRPQASYRRRWAVFHVGKMGWVLAPVNTRVYLLGEADMAEDFAIVADAVKRRWTPLAEAAAARGVTRQAVWKQVRSGALAGIRVGQRTYVLEPRSARK